MSTGRDEANTRPISRVTVVLLIVPAVLLWLDAQHEPYAQFTVRAALAGDQDRWRAAIARVSGPALSTALTWDYVFIASWVAVVVPMCKWAIDQWGPVYRRETAWRFLPIIALAAAVFDLIEDVLLGLFHDHVPPSVALVILSTVSWLKLTAYAVSIVGIVLCVLGPAVLPLLRARVRAVIKTSTATPAGLPDTHPAPMARTDAGTAAEGIGICLSGGGIRAAGIAFGALRSLERGAGSPLGRARWVAAVSGGGYTACGWWVTRELVKPVPDPFFAATSAWPKTVMERVRYLENPVGGLAWGVVQVLARMLLVLGAVFGVAYLVGLFEGLLIRSDAVHEHFTFKTGLFPARLSTPGLTLVTAGIVLFAVSGFLLWRSGFTKSAHALVEPAKLLLLAGAALVFALVVGPAIVKYVPGLLYKAGHPGASNDAIKSNTGKGAGLFGVLTSLGIVAAIVGLMKRTVQRIWLRLGGVLLALAWLLVVEQVMQHVVVNRPAIGPWLTGSVWAVLGYVAFALLVLADSVPAHQETLNGIYRKRLAGTFALGPGEDGAVLEPVAAKHEIEWSEYPQEAPEFIVCATAHSAELSRGGVKAHGFTFDRSNVTYFADDTTFVTASSAYPAGSAASGFPRRWTVTRSMAISGAALASAMGRQALGTTNALLAATSLRLGAWVPNPRFAADFTDTSRTPRVHIGYLAKEIFGLYRPKRDPFVYVADGGHRDNLGLSELLRKTPKVAFVVDASGDTPGKFTTLNECIALVQLEQGIQIDMTWPPIVFPETDLPDDCATVGTITYRNGQSGVLVYGRYQPCNECSGPLQAYAKTSPPFPYYSTGDQVLEDHEFEMLLQLGEHVGQRMCAIASEIPGYADIV